MDSLKHGSARKRSTVLLVLSCPARKDLLAATLRTLGAEILWVQRGREARNLLQTRPPLDAVVTDATLEDANWCDVLRAVVEYRPQATVVVVAPSSADEILWSEILWRGVYDMLVEPFAKSEARQVLQGALQAASRGEQTAVA